MSTLAGFDSRILFTALVLLAAVGRLLELRIAKRNLWLLLARGGIEVSPGHYPWMVALHTTWLIAWCGGLLPPVRHPWLGFTALALSCRVPLRYWVSRPWGRWATLIICLRALPRSRANLSLAAHPNTSPSSCRSSRSAVHTAWLPPCLLC